MNRNELPILIKANRTTVGFLSAQTKTDPKMVLVNLRDMANMAIERLKSRTGRQKKTWTSVTYPNTDMRFKIDIEISMNYILRQAHYDEVYSRFLADGGIDRIITRKQNNYSEHAKSWNDWSNKNPNPYKDYDYTCIMVECTYKPKNEFITLSQEEIDTILIEDILFAKGDSDEA